MLEITAYTWSDTLKELRNTRPKSVDKIKKIYKQVIREHGVSIPQLTQRQERNWCFYIGKSYEKTYARILLDTLVVYRYLATTPGWSLLEIIPMLMLLNDENEFHHDHRHTEHARCTHSVIEIFAAATTLLRATRLDEHYSVYVETDDVFTGMECKWGWTPSRNQWRGTITIKKKGTVCTES